MYKIIKPKSAESIKSRLDMDKVKSMIVKGMKEDAITDLMSCVTYLNENGISTDGNTVNGTFKRLHKELMDFSKTADRLASDGNDLKTIIKNLNKVNTVFNINDLQQMKIELYGSIKNWQAKMTEV
jgi:uncharacterized protein YpuA (DUF1002 family)